MFRNKRLWKDQDSNLNYGSLFYLASASANRYTILPYAAGASRLKQNQFIFLMFISSGSKCISH